MIFITCGSSFSFDEVGVEQSEITIAGPAPSCPPDEPFSFFWDGKNTSGALQSASYRRRSVCALHCLRNPHCRKAPIAAKTVLPSFGISEAHCVVVTRSLTPAPGLVSFVTSRYHPPAPTAQPNFL